MKIIFFSSSFNTIDEFITKHNLQNILACYDNETLNTTLKNLDSFVLIVDYDSVAQELNKFITSNTLAKNVIVLERVPELATGKMLISHKVKAYGNIRMQTIHYQQMIESVKNNKVWTYPELTAALVKETKKPTISEDSTELIKKRLSDKEKAVVYLILDGLTNNAISVKLKITIRTVKAHISSIFTKLHINDRVSLVLLLR